MTNPPLWKASVALTKIEAADCAAALELDGSAQAVLIVEEPFADGAVVEALYTDEPNAAYLSRIAGRTITVAPLPDQDWIKLSQQGLPPVRAGRFFVYGAHDAGTVPHFNVLRAKVALANARPPLINAQNNYRIAKNNLSNLLGYDLPRHIWDNIPLNLTDTLDASPYSINLSDALQQALNNRTPIFVSNA